jgi:hypothetical protein
MSHVTDIAPLLTARRILANPREYFERQAGELSNLAMLLRITGRSELAARVEHLANLAWRLRRPRLESDSLRIYAMESCALAENLKRLVVDGSELAEPSVVDARDDGGGHG